MLLPRDAVFSIFMQSHLKEAILLSKVLYYAKDWDTLHKTAVWARNHVNHGTFLYSLSVALIHRKDTYGMPLPPIHEVFPHYFFSDEVIQKAQILKQKLEKDTKQTDSDITGNKPEVYFQ